MPPKVLPLRLRLLRRLEGFAAAAVLTGLLASAAGATTDSGALSPQEAETVARVEAYLNGLTTLRSRFVQVNSFGAYVEGDLSLQRPGRLRFEYDDPHPILMIANGSQLLFYDRSQKQATFVPLAKTPLRFIASETIRLRSDAEIREVDQSGRTVRITLADQAGGFGGTVTLVFRDRPLELRKWEIVNEKGVLIEVGLINPRFGATVDEALFDLGGVDLRAARSRPSGNR